MRIGSLIEALQKLPPDDNIMIDSFKKVDPRLGGEHYYTYQGFQPIISIDMDRAGVYHILSRFQIIEGGKDVGKSV